MNFSDNSRQELIHLIVFSALLCAVCIGIVMILIIVFDFFKVPKCRKVLSSPVTVKKRVSRQSKLKKARLKCRLKH